jgi:type II secretory pathway component PulK
MNMETWLPVAVVAVVIVVAVLYVFAVWLIDRWNSGIREVVEK